MDDKRREITEECYRQAENCLYTSTSLYIWLRILRATKISFVGAPLVLGSLGAWQLLSANNVASVRTFASVCAFVAGLLPTIYAALKFDKSLDAVARSAMSFKVLQDEFRQLALIHSHDPIEEYQKRFESAMAQMSGARTASLTPPEWVFRRAQKKVKSGDYDFDHDKKKDNGKQPTPPDRS